MPLLHIETVGDTEADLVPDTLAVPLLVKGCVVPMAESVGVRTPEREAPEPLTARDALPEGVRDEVTLAERVSLGEGLTELVKHSDGDSDEERVGLLLVLMLRVTDTVTEVEDVEEGLTLVVWVAEPERDTLIERVPDTVALRVIVPLPDKHSVGD